MEPVDVIPVYLHVPVHGASSVKFRSNYWLLQPWYIKQEMWPGLLHVYNSAFSCGCILRRVEEMTATFGDVYKVSMIDGWCGKHRLEAVVARLICTGLPAVTAWNLRT